MPANRMNEASTGTWKVIGNSSAMVSAGPSPGRTPIAVPSVVPSRHHIRLESENATLKPCASCVSVSIVGLGSDQLLDDAGADVDAERLGEAEIGGERQHQPDQRVGQRPA